MSEQETKPKKSAGKWLRDSFVAGLFVLAPVVITVWLIRWVFNLLTSWVGEDVGILTRLLTLLLVIAAIIIIGAITKNYFGKKLFSLAESMLGRVPLVKKVYGAIKQMSEAFGGKGSVFKQVVFIDDPQAGKHSIGFIMADAPEEVAKNYNEKVYTIYVPTTPSPTSGSMQFVPESKLTFSKMKVAEAIQLVISSGAVKPK